MKMKVENNSGLIKRAKYYGISEDVIHTVLKRDKVCVYCSRKMKTHALSIGTPSDKKTIEHFNEEYEYAAKEEGVGICCGSCNSSRSDKNLLQWFKTKYCLDRNINMETVAQPVKNFIAKSKKKKK